MSNDNSIVNGDPHGGRNDLCLDFLKKIVPATGYKFVTEWIVKPSHPRGGVMVHHPVADFDDAVDKIKEIDARGNNAYYAMATYKEVKHETIKTKRGTDFTYVVGRTQDNAQSVKALWMDWDVGKADTGMSYNTRNEALAGIKAYVAATGLPTPLVVSSGYGIHTYWIFTDEVPAAEWERVACLQRVIMRHLQIKFDPSRDKDCSSVLRPVGSHNFKEGKEPKLVKVVALGDAPLPAAEYRRILQSYLDENDLTSQASLPSYMQGGAGNLGDFGSNDYPTSHAEIAIQHCNQLAEFAKTGGASEPIWYAGLGLTKYFVDGEKFAHECSAKHEDYDYTHTQMKLDQWTYGPTTCEKYREINPSGCANCSQKCKSTIRLGIELFQASNAAAPTPDVGETLNDAANAERFVCQFAAGVRYVVELHIWIVWFEGHWRYDYKGQIIELAKSAAKSIFDEAKGAANQANRAALSRWANASLQLPRLEAMVKLAQASLAVAVHELDADPMLFAVTNGVVDLRNGEFRKSRPENLITKIANVEYDASVACPSWEAFLDGCMGGKNGLVGLLQRAGGYSLTGSTAEQVFFFLHGDGLNGKSTLVNALREIMGGYGVQSQPDVVMAQRNSNPSGPTPEIARLAGRRFVAMVETEDGQRLAESRIKQMTGGDAMTARVLHGTPFDFVPIFKLWLAGNHRPVIRGDDHGIWRRIVLIPFAVKVSADKRDNHLAEKLRNEYPGILNWLIQGCLDWQRHGLELPNEVMQEIEHYKSDMDLIAQWFDERCEVAPEKEFAARSAYQDYANWAKQGGHNVITEVRFAQKLDERGFSKRRTRAGKFYIGLSTRQGMLV